ncbi:MAG TPA: radical SAM protein, partial [Verrucomicrobiae bacterium]|nr:radical SAM protein [Verrucomicrobiae bacterium]
YPCVMCHMDRYSVPGVFAKPLAAVFAEGVPLWKELLEMSRRRADDIPECAGCADRAYCSAGCLGRAWGSAGGIMCPDDRCEARKTAYRHR